VPYICCFLGYPVNTGFLLKYHFSYLLLLINYPKTQKLKTISLSFSFSSPTPSLAQSELSLVVTSADLAGGHILAIVNWQIGWDRAQL
jgi:hypothetical protein